MERDNERKKVALPSTPQAGEKDQRFSETIWLVASSRDRKKVITTIGTATREFRTSNHPVVVPKPNCKYSFTIYYALPVIQRAQFSRLTETILIATYNSSLSSDFFSSFLFDCSTTVGSLSKGMLLFPLKTDSKNSTTASSSKARRKGVYLENILVSENQDAKRYKKEESEEDLMERYLSFFGETTNKLG
jgi:hypothetical protein